ncbi:MAG: hypothetical protein GY832_44695 [Chloroflexi bacterium]|nr:hypothetical protein [Chloroflexota bacterium]
MKTKQVKSLVISCVLALILLLFTIQFVSASADPGRVKQPVAIAPPPSSSTESGQAVPLQQPGGLTATLRAASKREIEFWTLNRDMDAGAQQSFIPHLILYQDGKLTPEVSRAPIVTTNSVLSFSSLNSVIQKQEIV